jgi:uncharacterized protein
MMLYRLRIGYLILAVIVASFCLTSPAVYPMTFPIKPIDTVYVDDAHLLEPSALKELNDVISQLWQQRHITMRVVTIPSLQAKNASRVKIEEYAKALFKQWGIGQKTNSTGILLLVSKDDRQARIALGEGWGKTYDPQAEDIMNDSILPELKQGNFSAGIMKGTHGLDALARQLPLAETGQLPSWTTPVGFVAVLFMIAAILSWFKNRQYGWAGRLLGLLSSALSFILRKIRH